MRIAYVIPNFDPSHGGMQRDAFETASGLAAGGNEVTVFTSVPPPNLNSLPQRLKITILDHRSRQRHRVQQSLIQTVPAIIEEQGPWDIVEGFCRTPVGNVYRAGGGTHKAYLRQVNSYRHPYARLWELVAPKNHYYHRLERSIFGRSDVHYITNSRKTRREIIETFSVPERRISVIYPGVNTDQFSPERRVALRAQARRLWQVPDSSFTLAFVGTGFFRKGLAFVFQMVCELKARGIATTVLVAGKGKLSSFGKLARHLGIDADVRFLGHQRSIVEVLAAADLFTLPSLFEPFGIAPLEAMACGMPILLTKNCGITELLTDSKEGLLLDSPEETACATDFLEELARNAAKREAMGRAARETAEGLGKERYCREVLQVYRSVRNHCKENAQSSTNMQDYLYADGQI